MLELRPNCECCDADLPPDSMAARICTFECTFCVSCADGVLRGKCPNCGGELVRRPIRPAEKLARNPASTIRRLKAGGCATAIALLLAVSGCADQQAVGGGTRSASPAREGAGFANRYVGASTRYKALPKVCPSPSRLDIHVLDNQFTYRLSGTVQFQVQVGADGSLSARAGDYVLSGQMTNDKLEGDIRNDKCGFHFLARRRS